LCDTEWGCRWILSLIDSAGNILDKTFNITNIDKTQPTIHINKYAEILNWEQKVGIRCEDIWWSGCVSNIETIYWLQLWTTSNKCVFDNAWNSMCSNVVTDQSERDYSDNHLDWTRGNRTIFLNCIDEPGWSGCTSSIVKKTIYSNTPDVSLTIKDYAWNSLTKHFQISKIDKIKPSIQIFSLNNFKASDWGKIKISSYDDDSWIDKITYKWNSSCVSWINLIGNFINNNERINYTISWAHILYVCAIDIAWNINESTKNITIYPWDIDQVKTTIEVSSKLDKFANNIDYYYYILTLRDKYNNVIYDKNVDCLEYSLDSEHKKILTNMTNIPSWSIATTLECNNYLSNKNWEIYFYITSIAPWEFTERFKISLNNWGHNYIDKSSTSMINIFEKTSDTNFFKQPISWDITVIAWWNTPEMWKKQKYQIKLFKSDNNNFIINNNFNWKLNISDSTIIHKNLWHFWNTFTLINDYFWNNLDNYLWFSWSIDANDNILEPIKIGLNNLIISYNFLWNDIKYYLDEFWNSWCEVNTLWLKVLWTLQWDWKSNITWQKENFSDLSKPELRSKIRMNWYKLIKLRKSWSIVNWVKYVEWNEIILWDLDYETLIVKNWNVIIDWNLNISNNKLWIIILKDNYLIDSDYNNLWNIYVNNNVTEINAIIYTDWAFRSADSEWNSYPDAELNNKLELYWSLFTRNTIGWAVIASNKYLLPWWQETDNFSLAEIYDLNYIRKVDNQCIIGEDYSFLIKYNSLIHTNPPKGFNIK